MTHFGIICPAAPSHLNLMFNVGNELKQRGHQLTLCGSIEVQSQTVARGLEFRAIGQSEFPAGAMAQYLSGLGKRSGLSARRYVSRLMSRWVDVLLRDAPEACKDVGVEILLVDNTSFEGGTVAEYLDIPFVTLCSGLVTHQHPSIPPWNTPWRYSPTWWGNWRNQAGYRVLNSIDKPIWDVVENYRQGWKLPPLATRNDAYSKLAQISHQPAEFEFPRTDLPDYFHFTGPFHNPANRKPLSFPYEKLTGQPLIYASMGTIQNKRIEVFQTIASACEGLDVQLVVSLAGSMPPESLPQLPGNPIVVSFAPQLQLLEKATLTITHAGLHTTLESLSYGVPMVAIPVTNDQPGVAARIAWTGTGEVIPLKKLRVSRLRNAIKKVLTQESYKQNALNLQALMRQSGGVKRAADIIEEAVLTKKPVSR
ncbi:glycosyltransferase [Coleofasciculus sp. G2-EDA-02]|uniref:glycosyltransferase n=1 Tax=Coleofasciculus sp. G2-EDA-02 TaxID=3069529 RepID=UPI0032F68A3A